MTKNKKVNFVALGIVLSIPAIIYLLFLVGYLNSFQSQWVNELSEVLFWGSLGFAASVLALLFFHGKVFISWVKHIAWWFVILAIVMVMNTDQGGFLPFYDRVQVALFWMAILFVVTVIYAAFMQYRLKNRLKKKEADHTHDW